MAFPFICAGQARSGTTWLATAFSACADYFTPPIKEWNYLSALAHASRDLSFLELLDNPVAQKSLYFKYALSSFTEQYAALDHQHFDAKGARDHLKWWRQYLFQGLALENYVQLFSTNELPTYDISPEYLLIDADTIAKASAQIPAIRIIILLRHPPSRFRSHLSLLHTKNRLVLASANELDHIEQHCKAHRFISDLEKEWAAEISILGLRTTFATTQNCSQRP